MVRIRDDWYYRDLKGAWYLIGKDRTRVIKLIRFPDMFFHYLKVEKSFERVETVSLRKVG